MEITRVSKLSGIERTIDLNVTENQYNAWRSGVKIQDAMPNLNATEREFIISGVTDEEWNNAFGEEL